MALKILYTEKTIVRRKYRCVLHFAVAAVRVLLVRYPVVVVQTFLCFLRKRAREKMFLSPYRLIFTAGSEKRLPAVFHFPKF